ncbi:MULTISPECIES: hypothetical protein [Chryseobacterium]|uniref:GLPGLI family protein n=1 Tax=Chryseobacterium camelliae TaxID=1265445 RepID=A0ABU0TNE8_9FLAO|nr:MULTISPECIES: hypothetical protein [Chryseobacterium]MDT3407571.1 hypothetical protein [Pseudacidovorax intermedius]MDQ1098576.1 hypothetical protein [Chryseobacterium camelliae]MDQ1102500.1 hypothetical protein [Chryseobacterium sp. SORGH_AS_1048]MDR6085934.1 hypothetical protein [Chryseobacterium sp. SORGH_AS_0909]MDR6130300.1 hypothetical protein [Chryseobacterium sp. SORGH_AS_1175]
MESKQLNKIIVLLVLTINMSVFSQMKMADIEDKEFSVNLNTEKKSIIKIFENKHYDVFYILDRKKFDFDKKVRNVDLVNIIFFSKKYNKGILALFKQSIENKKKSIYDIRLHTGSAGNYMFIPSMIILDKDFNYEYLLKYYYMPLPPPKSDIYTSGIKIQDNDNRCNIIEIDIKGNILNENIDDILSNTLTISNDKTTKSCDPIVYDIDLKDFFPKKINKNGPVYYKK